MKSLLSVLTICLCCLFAANSTLAQTIDSMPPVVVKTVPESGRVNIAPGDVEIQVTFSKDMTDGTWSWTEPWKGANPAILEKPKYEANDKTCVLKVHLEPNKTYAYWINSDKFQNFKDRQGHPSVPYLLIFQTGPAATSQPRISADQMEVEHQALRISAAIRDKDDAALQNQTTDNIAPGYRQGLPQFAAELRERMQEHTGKPFNLLVGESLVEGDSAAVKCTQPNDPNGIFLVLFFVKTPDGWRNCNLRNSPPQTTLAKHLQTIKGTPATTPSP